MKWLEMYFDKEISKKFAELEQNERNFKVSEIVDKITMEEIKCFWWLPLHAVELWWWAHPDRYHDLFKYLIKSWSKIDWVDISLTMLNLAKSYLKNEFKNRIKVINFIESDIEKYLKSLDDNELDIIIMKYTFEFIENLDDFFFLISKKLKNGRSLISTISHSDENIKIITTNTKFFINWKDFWNDKELKVRLKDWDRILLKFFKESWNPDSGFLEWAETMIYYHSFKKIINSAKKHNLKVFIQDWNDFLPMEKKMDIKQTILLIRK